MNLKTGLISFGLMVFIGAFTVGCGADCESVCEDQSECEGAPDIDCADTCEAAEKAAEEADCSDEFDDYISCIGDSDDVCKPDTSCSFSCGAAAQ